MLTQMFDHFRKKCVYQISMDAKNNHSLHPVYHLFGDLTSLQTKKRKRILSDFGYDPSLRRPLEKMESGSWNQNNLKLLKKIFADPMYRKFVLHLKSINSSFFIFFSLLSERKFRPRISFNFLNDVIQIPNRSQEELLNIIQILEEIQILTSARLPQSVSDLIAMEQSRIENLAKNSFTESIFFYPDPPFEGDVWIQPIQSNLALFEEGKRQHNCVYDYDKKIREGRFYLYHITGKVPCTVSFLKIDEDWYFDQIAGPCNKPADPDTYHRLEAWRLRHGILILGDVFRLGKAPTWMLD